MNKQIVIVMNMEKVGNATVKFTEPVKNEFSPEKLGSIYLNKVVLAENNYKGEPVTITIRKNSGKDDDGIPMAMEKVTKGTVKFTEVLPNEFTPAIIGQLYISKFTLAEIDYNGEYLSIDVEFNAESEK